MKSWKAFKVIAEDYNNAYRMILPAPSKKEAEIAVGNYGMTVVKAEEMSDFKINVEFLAKTMASSGFNDDEIDIVTRLIQFVNLAY